MTKCVVLFSWCPKFCKIRFSSHISALTTVHSKPLIEEHYMTNTTRKLIFVNINTYAKLSKLMYTLGIISNTTFYLV